VIADIKQRTGAVVVNVFPDSPFWITDLAQIEAYDLFFLKDRYAIQVFSLAGLRNLHYLPTYCVPAFHHPVAAPDADAPGLAGAVALVGSHYPYRERFLRAIADYPVRVWGPGWSRCRDPHVRRLVAGGAVFGHAKLVVYSTARLSLNIHHPIDVAGVNMRTFELAAAGENARRRALAEHTIRHRIDEILGAVSERLGVRW
jgi:hypothetical protein